MEEDIKMLEDKDIFWNYPENQVLEAIEHILQAYKEDEAVIEEIQKIINKNISKEKIFGNEGWCLDFDGCQQVTKEIIYLLEKAKEVKK